MTDPIKPKRELYDFLVSKKLVSNPSYEDWSAKKSTPEEIDKIYSTMSAKGLTTSKPDQFKSKYFEAIPVKKKDGGTSGFPTAPTVANVSESNGAPIQQTQGIEPISNGASIGAPEIKSAWDQQPVSDKPAKPPKPIFNTTPKFALDDMLMAGVEPTKTPSWTFTGSKPVDRVLQLSGTEDISSWYAAKRIQEDPEGFIGQAAQMDPDGLSKFNVEARRSYADQMVKQRTQSLTNLNVKKEGFHQRFLEDMKRLEELSDPSSDEAIQAINEKEKKGILDYYQQFSGDPDFQLLANAEKGLGKAQEEVQKEIDEIKKRNGPKEARAKMFQLYSDIAQKTSPGTIGPGMNVMGRWAARTIFDKAAEAASLADMALPTQGFSPLIALSDKLHEFGQETFTAPTNTKQSVFELAPKGFKESVKGVEIAKTKYKGEDVEVIHAGGKPIELRKNGFLVKTLSEEEAATYQGLPTERRTNTGQALLNIIGVGGDMFADIGVGGAAFRALSITGKAAKYGTIAGIASNIFDSTYRELRGDRASGMSDADAKFAALLTAGGIASVNYFVGPVEKYIGSGMGVYSGSVRKSMAELVARGGLNPFTASSVYLKNYAKFVGSEVLEETLLEKLPEIAVGYAFKEATGEDKYHKEFKVEEVRDAALYSIPIALTLSPGAAKAETNNYLGAAYLKTIEDAEKTSKYISQLVQDGTINADQALMVEKNLKAARSQMPLLRDNLEPDEKEHAAKLVFLDAQYDMLGKDAPPTGKAHYKALQEAVAKELNQYYSSEVVTDEALDVKGEPDEKEAKRKAVIEEINSKNLSHVEGLGMGANQAQGTYVSTEANNRYGEGKPVDVAVENPFVSTDDPGLVEMRMNMVRENMDRFEAKDFVDDDGMIIDEIPENIKIENLSSSGMKKASELVTEKLKEQGFDSVYFPESDRQEGELIVFDKEGVKFKEPVTKVDEIRDENIASNTQNDITNEPQETEETQVLNAKSETPASKTEETKEQRALRVRRARQENVKKQYKKLVDKVEDSGMKDATTEVRAALLSGAMLDPKSIAKELGYKIPSKEMNQLFSFWKSAKKGGISIEKLAEQLEEETGLNGQDLRNEIIRVLSSEGASGRKGIADILSQQMDVVNEEGDSYEDWMARTYGEFPEHEETLADAERIPMDDETAARIVDEYGNPLGPVSFDQLPKEIQEEVLFLQEMERFKVNGAEYDFIRELAEKGDFTSFEQNFKDDENYEDKQSLYTHISGNAEVSRLGGTTVSALAGQGQTYESETPTAEGIEGDPDYQASKAQRDAELDAEIENIKGKFKKDWDSFSNLGFAFNFKSQAQKDADMAKNALHLAYLYAKKGVNSFTDFVDAAGLKATKMWEDMWESAQIIHRASMAPVFFSEELNFLEDVRNTMQDANYGLLKFIREAEKQGIPISDELNAYRKQELEKGKVKSKIDQMTLFLFGRDRGSLGHGASRAESFFGRLQKDGFSQTDLNMYWTAKHVPERNARGREITGKKIDSKIKELNAKIANEQLKANPDQKIINGLRTQIADIRMGTNPRYQVVDNAAHMSDAEAQQLLDQFTPEQQETLEKYRKEFSEKVIKPRINDLLEAGVITKEAADALLTGSRSGYSSKFDYYLPMMVKEDALEPGELSASGIKITFDRSGKGVGGSGIKGLKGTSRYSWIKGDIYDGVEMAIVQYAKAAKIAENNNTRMALHDLVEGLADRMGGRGAVIASRAVPTISDSGEMTDVDNFTPQHIIENSVKVFKEGKTRYVYLPPHKDSDGNWVQHPIVKIFNKKGGDGGKLGKMAVEGSRMVINAMRNLVTTWNIGFGPVNFLSDIQDALQNLGDVKAEYKLDRWRNHVRTRTLRNIPAAFAVLANPKKMHFKGALPGSVDEYSMKDFWQEFVENGGPISWSQYESLPKAVEAIQKKMDAFYHGESMPKVAGRVTANVLGYVNDVLENQTRLSVYAALRQGGLTAEQAAQAAKNISLNFEKKGAWGAAINNFYMFANAGIQGTARTAKNLKNIKRTAPMLAARMLWIGGMRELAHYLAEDDDDPGAEEQFNKVLMDSWKSSNYNIYPNPWDPKNPITIRKPYSMLRLVDVISESAVDMAHGRITGADYQLRMLTAVATTLDPIGGGSTEITGYIPTVAKLFVEPFVVKKDYTGRELIPFVKEYMPLYTQYNYGKEGVSFEIATRVSEALAYGPGGAIRTDNKKKETIDPGMLFDYSPAQLQYFFSQLVPGLPSEITKSVAEIVDAHKEGRGVDPGQIILLRRFYKQMEKNHNSDVALIYDFINRPKGSLFGLSDTSTQFQKDMVLAALKRTKATAEKESYSRMKSKLKEKFPEWEVK